MAFVKNMDTPKSTEYGKRVVFVLFVTHGESKLTVACRVINSPWKARLLVIRLNVVFARLVGGNKRVPS